MSTLFRSVALIILTTLSLIGADWIFSQGPNNLSTFPAYGGAEAADDFTLQASVEKVSVTGYLPGGALSTSFQGVRVIFYANASGAPGSVAADYTVAAGDPRIVYSNNGYANFAVTLPTPFLANGTYYLSVQILGEFWSWGSSDASGQSAYTRTQGGAWQAASSGLAFGLYGTITGPGQITGLSSTSVPRSGYFEILGSNFAADGRVLVNGVSAPIATWTSTKIAAYVPEAVTAGSALVQVDNGAGLSNSFPVSVTDRASSGRIRWSLRMEAPYAAGDPAVAPDGTIYVLDIFNRLYALTGNGGIKWVVRGAGNRGPSLGPDGTIYVANETTVRAYNPDGTVKWTFVQPSYAFFLFDVAVGPDGNIYAVATSGLGTFSLTPAGVLRWAFPEPYNRPNVDRGDIVFGPNGSRQQLYFYSNAHTPIYDLAGSLVGYMPAGQQPRVSQFDGSVHMGGSAYTPNAALLWSVPQLSLQTAFGLGPDGTHYGVDGQFTTLWAIRPNGTAAWSLPFTTGEYFGFLGVNQQNTTIVLAGVNTSTGNFIKGVSVPGHNELFRVTLPLDPVSGAGQSVQTNPVFSPDGATTLVTTTVSGISRAYLYAVDVLTFSIPNAAPVAQATATPSSGPAPLVVTFSGAGSSDADGTIASYSWNFGDGTTGTGISLNHTYNSAGTYDAILTVRDNLGATGSATVRVTATASTSTMLRTTAISMSARRNGSTVTATGQVTVRNTAGVAAAGAAVSASWRKPDGSTVTQSAMTNSSGVASFTTTGGRGTYTLTVTNVVKAGYTFDAAGSVLTGSITR